MVADTPLPKLQGMVVAAQANYYRVKLEPPREPSQPRELLCTRRSRLKKMGQQVMVGDRVLIEEPDWAGQRGAIAEVLPRRTVLDRPPIANADQILLVFALEDPALDPNQLSRFLVKAESTGLDVLLCLNKTDLVSGEQQAQWQARLQTWGYAPLLASLYTEQGLMELVTQLQQKVTVICGPSGVGKSSLIKALIPDSILRIGQVSERWGRGRHTTRHVELFELLSGGLLADSPGFNQPDLNCSPAVLAEYFPEARQRLAQAACQFNDCLHREEPNCEVRGSWERYPHYLDLLSEVLLQQEQNARLGDPESTIKFKAGAQGGEQTEPKLAPKRYRRASRRVQQQALQKLYQEVEEYLPES